MDVAGDCLRRVWHEVTAECWLEPGGGEVFCSIAIKLKIESESSKVSFACAEAL